MAIKNSFMSTKNLAELVKELNTLIRELKYEEALDRFYSTEIVSVENENPPMNGLAAYRNAAKKYLSDISNYSAQLKNQIIGDDIVVTEWHYKFQHKEWGAWDRTQISVQRWKDGKIVHERHHYKTD
jgi:SnoaL-like protein